MELAGAFLTMVAPRPWNGPLSPFTWNAVFTLPSTPVKAAASRRHTQLFRQAASCLHGHTNTLQPQVRLGLAPVPQQVVPLVWQPTK